MVNLGHHIMQKHSINHQSLAERDLSNLRGRDQNGNSISISQVLIGSKSILDDSNYLSAAAKDTPIKPEIAHNVAMLKRNTYQTVIKDSDSHDYVNHHTKKHSQSPPAVRCEVKSIIQMDELANQLRKKDLPSHRLSPIHTLNNEHYSKPLLLPSITEPDTLHPTMKASFESSIMSDPRRDAHNFRLKLIKNNYGAAGAQ